MVSRCFGAGCNSPPAVTEPIGSPVREQRHGAAERVQFPHRRLQSGWKKQRFFACSAPRCGFLPCRALLFCDETSANQKRSRNPCQTPIPNSAVWPSSACWPPSPSCSYSLSTFPSSPPPSFWNTTPPISPS